MGTLLHLPDTLKGHPEYQGGRRGDLPENVVPIRKPRYPVPLSTEGYVILALIGALETRAGLKQIRDGVFQTLVKMFGTWRADEAVRAYFNATLELTAAKDTGKW